jgi:hypothetical protein
MSRKLGKFDVSQRTQDGYFNATELLKQWNKNSGMQKQMSHFTENQATKEFIETLEIDELTKERNSVLIQLRGKSGGTWMHPYLFIDFAMWLNPRFKLEVIRFVYDQLIQFRHSAGDNYRGLTSAISRFDGVNYSQLAKGLNYIVFDRHEEGIRQTATQPQLQQLTELQKQLAFAVDMGYIRSFSELVNEMRRIWNINHRYLKAS